MIVFICYSLLATAQEYINKGMQRMDSLKLAIKTAHSDTAQINLLNQLAQQYIDLNFLSSADSTARQALQIADRFNYPKHKGDSYNKIGLTYLTINAVDSARTYFIKALEEDKRSKNRYLYIKHLGNIGICYNLELKFDQALNCQKSALRLAELFKEKQVLPFCYNNIGLVYINRARYKEALAYLPNRLLLTQTIVIKTVNT